MTKRVWHKGPPPFPGWYESSVQKLPGVWRWWNGVYWSHHVTEGDGIERALSAASVEALTQDVEWTDYWPKNARVPRADPRSNSGK